VAELEEAEGADSRMAIEAGADAIFADIFADAVDDHSVNQELDVEDGCLAGVSIFKFAHVSHSRRGEF